jgi:Ca-activated chloride channel family protein
VLAILPIMRMLAICLGIIALARPQFGILERTVNSLGFDIAMVIDVSGSMQNEDYPPRRIEVAKQAAIDFVRGRNTDRLSVVVFAKSAALLCPPTLDMQAVEFLIDAVTLDMIDNTRTAVGEGLLLAVKKLENSPAKSKIVVLLTDGENNVDTIKPLQAAEAAQALGVRVYTIGMMARMNTRAFGGNPFTLGAGGSFDDSELKKIAEMTGGQYFRASDEDSLRRIYEDIDRMERSDIEVRESADYEERFFYFWFPGLLLLGLEFLLRAFWLRRLP